MADDEKKRMLIVEDEAPARLLLRRTFEKYGFQVETAEDGLDCLRKLEDFKADIILTDMMMPVLDGLELIKAIRRYQETKSIPIIAITAKTDAMSMIEGINAGATGYVNKPFKAEELFKKVQNCLSR